MSANPRERADRTVHALVQQPSRHYEIVRYATAGKWYWETPSERGLVPLEDAVDLIVDARQSGYPVIWRKGLDGGAAFDRKVKDALDVGDLTVEEIR